MNKEIEIRKVGLGDIPMILAIQEATGLSRWSKKAYRGEISPKDSIFLAALFKGAFAGFSLTRLMNYDHGKSIGEYELCNIGISPEYQGLSLGSRLIESTIEMIPSDFAIFCEVREMNHIARSFYKKKGFSEVGFRKDYYPSPPDNAILLSLKNHP